MRFGVWLMRLFGGFQIMKSFKIMKIKLFQRYFFVICYCIHFVTFDDKIQF